MLLEFTDLDSPLLSRLTVTSEKLWGKKNGVEQGLINQQKMIT